MRWTGRGARPDALGCGALGRMGLVAVDGCCAVCHSADGYAGGRAAGPCHARLPDGREAYVCCAAKKQLFRIETRENQNIQFYGLLQEKDKNPP